MAVYPNSVRTFSTHVDLNETVFALHMNDVQDELVAVQSELGVSPKGTAATVRARLDGLDSGKASTGHDHANRLDNVLHDVTGRHLFGSALGNPPAPTTWGVATAATPATVGTDPAPAHADHGHAVPAQATVIDQIIPAGVIWEYGGTTLPAGNWLWCDGQSYLRTAPYDKLFTAIGTRYGAADGTHFNVPNRLGKFAMGAATVGAAVSTGGFTDQSLVAHTHPGSSVSAGDAAHVHWVSHGHHVGDIGDHNHAGAGGFVYVVSIGGAQNDYLVNSAAANRSSSVTYSDVHNAGGHGHNTDSCDRGNSDGASGNANHGHGLTIASDGSTGSNKNLPPYETVNYIIKF